MIVGGEATGLRSRRDRAEFAFVFRGWRSSLAQPPAKGLHPSGMPVEPEVRAVLEPGGFKAISRWLRRIALTPPESNGKWHRIPEGCQRASRSSSATLGSVKVGQYAHGTLHKASAGNEVIKAAKFDKEPPAKSRETAAKEPQKTPPAKAKP